jgi:hypothetical protein
MRTRLDEIVEEEFRCFLTDLAYANMINVRVKRATERAYQEGVSDALMAEGVGQIKTGARVGLHVSGKDVQPAPAKEKCPCGPVPHAPHEPPYHIRPDARKNERRMGNEARNFVHGPTRPETRPIYQANDYGSWQYDRRSGDDRRGAKF